MVIRKQINENNTENLFQRKLINKVYYMKIKISDP